ncbi:MAG: CPXCG motif-containing cysteine-rich protein [Merismopedia sp. SIO2A8]|nr:CPXCG motif-containing cysteine-rich protein [Merismopedia sp. SIO2A8]
MQKTADYTCAFCGELNTTFVDISAGFSQRYIEDCQVCCRPNILYLHIDEDTLEVDIQTDYEE